MNDRPYLTVRDVARRLGEPLHRVKYSISEYGIEPRTRCGIIRLFAEDQLPIIASAVKRVRERKGVQHAY